MITRICILLLLSLALTEVYRIVYFFDNSTAITEYNLFLSASYHKSITVLWYIYELCSILSNAIWAFVVFKIASKISSKLANVSLVFMWYYVSQSFFYAWNRNTSFFNNFCIYVCMGTVIFFILKPEKHQGKYRNME